MAESWKSGNSVTMEGQIWRLGNYGGARDRAITVNETLGWTEKTWVKQYAGPYLWSSAHLSVISLGQQEGKSEDFLGFCGQEALNRGWKVGRKWKLFFCLLGG